MLFDECMLHSSKPRLIAWQYNDNIEGLFLTNNKQVGMSTKHIDIRALFSRELQEKNLLNVLYEKTDQLTPDMLSKNLSQQTFQKHQQHLQLGSMMTWREDVGDD
jgi:hypothetical protein